MTMSSLPMWKRSSIYLPHAKTPSIQQQTACLLQVGRKRNTATPAAASGRKRNRMKNCRRVSNMLRGHYCFLRNVNKSACPRPCEHSHHSPHHGKQKELDDLQHQSAKPLHVLLVRSVLSGSSKTEPEASSPDSHHAQSTAKQKGRVGTAF